MTDSTFFDESREQSLVKARIVSKYFGAWAKVIIPTAKQMRDKIAYIDLYAGPGRYADGAKSTPMLVLERAIQDSETRRMLVALFNDKDEQNVHSLEQVINNLPDIDTLRYRPQVSAQEVGDEIVKSFERMRLVPTLLFLDPWGYKGLSLELVNAVVKDWACECIFFFNYNRINMGLGNEIVECHMDRLFGKARADRLRSRIATMSPVEREQAIVDELIQALKEVHGKFVLLFRFKNDEGTRTSHYLIFVSKSFKGYHIMKDVMAGESSTNEQDVPSFEYNPAKARQPLLVELSHPLDDLVEMLPAAFAGRTMTMWQVYEEHSVGQRYTARNYKTALLALEQVGRIKAGDHRKGTFGNDVLVTFPAKGVGDGS